MGVLLEEDHLGPSSCQEEGHQEACRDHQGHRGAYLCLVRLGLLVGHLDRLLGVRRQLAWAIRVRLGASSCQERDHLHHARGQQVLEELVLGL